MTIIARQDKKPIYLLQAEQGHPSDFINDDDSDQVKELKQFMIDKGIKAVYIRMLTLEEMLLIQGFPRDYKLIGTKANKTKFIGNSVPPVLARRLAEAGERALTQYIN
jgi:DNA (cytosine-5)-methyltransferase 1